MLFSKKLMNSQEWKDSDHNVVVQVARHKEAKTMSAFEVTNQT